MVRSRAATFKKHCDCSITNPSTRIAVEIRQPHPLCYEISFHAARMAIRSRLLRAAVASQCPDIMLPTPAFQVVLKKCGKATLTSCKVAAVHRSGRPSCSMPCREAWCTKALLAFFVIARLWIRLTLRTCPQWAWARTEGTHKHNRVKPQPSKGCSIHN